LIKVNNAQKVRKVTQLESYVLLLTALQNRLETPDTSFGGRFCDISLFLEMWYLASMCTNILYISVPHIPNTGHFNVHMSVQKYNYLPFVQKLFSSNAILALNWNWTNRIAILSLKPWS